MGWQRIMGQLDIDTLLDHVGQIIWTASQDSMKPLNALGIKCVLVDGKTNVDPKQLADQFFPLVTVELGSLLGEGLAEKGFATSQFLAEIEVKLYLQESELESGRHTMTSGLAKIFNLFITNPKGNNGVYLPGWDGAKAAAAGMAVFGCQSTGIMPRLPMPDDQDEIECGLVTIDLLIDIIN